jgi:Sec7-like guanine-nucleotide exchange factor
MKTPEFYKKITFVDKFDFKQHGLVDALFLLSE